jgi:ABC-type transporter Mla subunit MlaD
LPQTLRDVNSLLAELRGATAELSASAKGAHQIVASAGPEVMAAAQRIHTITDNLESTTEQIQQLVGDNRQDVRSFTRDGLPELERLVRDGRAAAEEIRELSSSLRQDPSQLLYQPPQQGMVIPR